MNKVLNLPIAAVGFISLLLIGAGCATKRKPDYHPSTPSASARIGRQAEIEVALDPFIERERTKQFFGINAIDDGIAILHVRVSNSSSNQTFLVEKKNFHLLLAGAPSGQTAEGSIERRKGGGEATAIVGASLGSFPLLVAGAAMISQATEIQRNFVGKEMPDQTLAPGQNMEGFVYYMPVKKKVDWSRGSTMKINFTDTKTQQVTELNVPLSH